MDGTYIFLGVITLLLLSYGGFSLHLLFNQRRLLYLPDRHMVATPESRGYRYEPLQITTQDHVTLHGWYVPARAPRHTVLFFHGNSGNISHCYETLEIMQRLECDCYLVDYRGYGLSEGQPSEQGTYRDAEAIWRYLVEEREIAPEKLVIFGRSLGGAVAIWLAARTQPRALIVESSFSSLPDLAQHLYPLLPARWLATIRYESKKEITKVSCPLLLIHSREDELIPFHQAQTLFSAAKGDKHLLEIHGNHGYGYLYSGQQYVEGLRDFLQRLPSVSS